jgi:hypothetical protein
MADFNLKEEIKKAEKILDLNERAMRIKQLKDHADMLRRMSGFVNSKNKNGKK